MPNLCRRARKSSSSSTSPTSSFPSRGDHNGEPGGYLSSFLGRMTNQTTTTVCNTVRTFTSPLRFGSNSNNVSSTPALLSTPIFQASKGANLRDGQQHLDQAASAEAAGVYSYFRSAVLSTIQRSRHVFGSAPQPHRTYNFSPSSSSSASSSSSLTRSTTPKRVTFKECKFAIFFKYHSFLSFYLCAYIFLFLKYFPHTLRPN